MFLSAVTLEGVKTFLEFLVALGILPLLYWWIRTYREAQLRREDLAVESQQLIERQQRSEIFRERMDLYKEFVLVLDDFLTEEETNIEKLKDLFFRACLSATDKTLREITSLLRAKLDIDEDIQRDRLIDTTVAKMRKELNRHSPEDYQDDDIPVSLFMKQFERNARARQLATDREWAAKYLSHERIESFKWQGLKPEDISEVVYGDRTQVARLPLGRADDYTTRKQLHTGHEIVDTGKRHPLTERYRQEFTDWRKNSIRTGVMLPPPPVKTPDVILPPFTVELVTHALAETVDWGLKALGIPELWKQTKGEGVKVCILDTGVDTLHPDLAPNVIEMKNFTTAPGIEDKNGHGTHCAGVVAALANKMGVVGVAPNAKLYIGKVLDDNGYGSYEAIIRGIEWAILHNVDVISMSLGGSEASEELHAVIKRAASRDIIVVCAAGNEGRGWFSDDTVGYPAKYPEVISVGSINRDMDRSEFSSVGDRVDVMAPGEEIYSTFPPQGYAVLSGTSMATPFVTGVAALCLAKHRKAGGESPCRNVKEMREHLRKTSTDKGKSGKDVEFGFGIINPESMILDLHNERVERDLVRG
ncbi:MAG: S8 family peptidase [Planctomycetes bacterium]|nr:S8 family peptidase [Planctomycetota bacterium]